MILIKYWCARENGLSPESPKLETTRSQDPMSQMLENPKYTGRIHRTDRTRITYTRPIWRTPYSHTEQDHRRNTTAFQSKGTNSQKSNSLILNDNPIQRRARESLYREKAKTMQPRDKTGNVTVNYLHFFSVFITPLSHPLIIFIWFCPHWYLSGTFPCGSLQGQLAVLKWMVFLWLPSDHSSIDGFPVASFRPLN